MSVLETAKNHDMKKYNPKMIDHIIKNNKKQKINLSLEQILSIIEETEISLLSNNFIKTFFSKLGDQFEMSENALYNITQLFNTNIKKITPENQEKIDHILLYQQINNSAHTKNNIKNTIKL